MSRLGLALLFLACPLVSLAQVVIPELPPGTQSFYYEDSDWRVEATSTPKPPPYGAPTPRSIPGARVIKTLQLKQLLDSNKSVVVVDVLESKERTTIPSAYWVPGAGAGQFYAAEKSRFAAVMDKVTGGDKTRPVVFLCLSAECWESYNASLHAIEAGYQDVMWYRGGSNSWSGASFPRKAPERISW